MSMKRMAGLFAIILCGMLLFTSVAGAVDEQPALDAAQAFQCRHHQKAKLEDHKMDVIRVETRRI